MTRQEMKQNKIAIESISGYLGDGLPHPASKVLGVVLAYASTPAGQRAFVEVPTEDITKISRSALDSMIREGCCVGQGKGTSKTYVMVTTPPIVSGKIQLLLKAQTEAMRLITAIINDDGKHLKTLRAELTRILKGLPHAMAFALVLRVIDDVQQPKALASQMEPRADSAGSTAAGRIYLPSAAEVAAFEATFEGKAGWAREHSREDIFRAFGIPLSPLQEQKPAGPEPTVNESERPEPGSPSSPENSQHV